MIELPRESLAIVGGGLSGVLTAWRALSVNPDLRVHIFERASGPEHLHSWSFNESDVPEAMREWLNPVIVKAWPRYDVRFPRRRRTLEIGYASTHDLKLWEVVQPFIDAGRLHVHWKHEVEPSDVRAGAVLDARGYVPRDDTKVGYQKFVGRMIRMEAPHGVDHPVIMDATVEQIDGYRFLYLLPFSDTEMLVEDTYFSDTPHLSENALHARIDDYIREKGWGEYAVLYDEKGVLPMATATTRDDATAEIGLRGGFAVAATGFTFPAALEVAEVVATAVRDRGVGAVEGAVAEHRRGHVARERYARLLNRMFFGAARPEKRYVILQRFYGLREGLIRRFYRNGLTWADKLRILVGKPPVPVTKALYQLSEKAYMARGTERREP